MSESNEKSAPAKKSKLALSSLALVIFGGLYLSFWPVSIEPVSWKAPKNPGYSGVFAANQRLAELMKTSIAPFHGPEDIALGPENRIYVPTHQGSILRSSKDGSKMDEWAKTGGRPLGIDFDSKGQLIVADAYRGLLSIAPDGTVTELTKVADGIPIRFADDVDVAADGKIYFSDASTKFGAKEFGGPLPASLVDIMEHGAHGRLLVYDPKSQKTSTLMTGINFANGVAVSADQRFVLVNETGAYRILRYWLKGEKKGQNDVLIDELPSFPDNISTGLNGRFWVGFMSPRNSLLDRLSDKPWARKVIMRLPDFLKPKPVHYGHIIAIDAQGKVVQDLQDPAGGLPKTTGVLESKEYIYVGSFSASFFGRLKKSKAGM